MIIQKLRKISNQYLVGIPRVFIRDFGWRHRDWIAIELEKKGVLRIFRVEIEPDKNKGRPNAEGIISKNKKE